MVKVICVICKDIGYTASPDYVLCSCGGRYRVAQEDRETSPVVVEAIHEENSRNFN